MHAAPSNSVVSASVKENSIVVSKYNVTPSLPPGRFDIRFLPVEKLVMKDRNFFWTLGNFRDFTRANSVLNLGKFKLHCIYN